MLAIPISPTLPTGGGGVAETIAAIASSALLLLGIGIWVRAMTRRTGSEPGTTVEFPTRSQHRAA